MPDVHQGYGMPIGGVIATTEAIIPNAVGVDIGCGMRAIQTTLKRDEMIHLEIKDWMGEVRERIPVGMNHHREAQDKSKLPFILCNAQIPSLEYDRARYQIGTLGGGNHFIEMQYDDDDYIWIMIHSGSRNVGYRTANYYNKAAKELNEQWHTSVPKNNDLAFLPIADDLSQSYLTDMNWCLEFARMNRRLMMVNCIKSLENVMGEFDVIFSHDIHHNYVAQEHHFGKNVWVHRKGATRAYENEYGIIPGSQGTCSYIVSGLGNLDSFKSCSHGAGRKMSRTKARNDLTLKKEIRILDDQGIIHGIRSEKDLDEATNAYKDIVEVINSQEGELIQIEKQLKPMAVIKG
jgi:tRNA-splicing ligase RtcB